MRTCVFYGYAGAKIRMSSGVGGLFLLESSFGQCNYAVTCSEVAWGEILISFLFDRVCVDYMYFCQNIKHLLFHSTFLWILKL